MREPPLGLENSPPDAPSLAPQDGTVVKRARMARAGRPASSKVAHESTVPEWTGMWSVLEASLNEIYVFDAQTLQFNYVNGAALRNLGFDLDAMRKLTPRDIKPDLSAAAFDELVGPLRRGERQRAVFQTVHRRSDGSRYPVEVHLQLVERRDRDVFLAIVNDITERKQAEAALHDSEARFRSVVASNMMGIIFWNAHGDITETNNAFLRMVGYTEEDVRTGRVQWSKMTPPEYRELDEKGIAEIATTGVCRPFEKEYIRKDGSRVPILIGAGALPQCPDEGVAFVLDISERKRAEAALQASEAAYRTLVETSHDLIWSVDAQGRWTFVNAAAKDIYGYEPAEMLGRPFMDFETPEQARIDLETFARIKAGTPHFNYETVHLRKDGSLVMLNFNAVVLRDEHGVVLGTTGTAQDITERKRTEAALRTLNAELEQRVLDRTALLAVKNKELETFSYSVSHDLKAPLRGIDGYSKLLLDDYADKLDDQGRAFIDNIRAAAGNMQQLIEDMLAYSRLERRDLAVGPVDLRATVQAVLRERDFDLAQVNLTVDLAVGRVLVDVDGLTIALRNLLDNALKFSRSRQPPMIEVRSWISGNRHIVAVRDNGTGFAMKHHDTIFQMFQRLHRAEDYAGTGIGLAIVRKAMDRMNGRVWAESEPNCGAVFYLDLPCAT